MSRKLELQYNDVEVGHPDLGFMPRDERIFTGKDGYCADDEDEEYTRWLAQKGTVARVVDGTIYVD